MAKFLKCTHKDGAALVVNFDYVYQIKEISETTSDGRMLTELSLMDAKSARTISVMDPLHSLEQQLVGK